MQGSLWKFNKHQIFVVGGGGAGAGGGGGVYILPNAVFFSYTFIDK